MSWSNSKHNFRLEKKNDRLGVRFSKLPPETTTVNLYLHDRINCYSIGKVQKSPKALLTNVNIKYRELQKKTEATFSRAQCALPEILFFYIYIFWKVERWKLGSHWRSLHQILAPAGTKRIWLVLSILTMFWVLFVPENPSEVLRNGHLNQAAGSLVPRLLATGAE